MKTRKRFILLSEGPYGGRFAVDTGRWGRGGASPGGGVDSGLGVWSIYGMSGDLGALFIFCPCR